MHAYMHWPHHPWLVKFPYECSRKLGGPLLLYVIDTLTWTITLKQNLIQQVTILTMEIKQLQDE